MLFLTGEHLTEDEVAECFTTLLGLRSKEQKPGLETNKHEGLYKTPMYFNNISLLRHTTHLMVLVVVCMCLCMCMYERACVYSEQALETVIPEEITMETFTSNILGFPTYSKRNSKSSLPE